MPIYIPKIKFRYQSVNEIMTLKEYWNLIGWEPFLAIIWELDFSYACSFPRMLMDNNNFRFTPIPDKYNALIFLKSPKTLFLGHIWPFLVIFAWWGFFPKNPVLSHKTIYGPLTPCFSFREVFTEFQKKLISQFRENLRTDRKTHRRTDRPYFIRPKRKTKGKKKKFQSWNY